MQRRSILAGVAVVHTLLVGGLLMLSVADLVKKTPPSQIGPVALHTLN